MSPAATSVLAQVAARLARYERFGVELGLERIERLLARLGNPQHQVPVVHVAGTNGKGSVCAYLSAVLTQAGYQVGCYTSPHLISWCDRITLNQQPIAPSALLSTLDQVEAAIAPASSTPTQFEVITAAMWLYFAQAPVDIAVVEVGLGGRLDATNVCEAPLVTVITSLSLEHWQRLGPTLAHIAYEKAGILKPGCPAVIGPIPEEAQQVIQQRLRQVGCPSIWPEPATAIGDQATYQGGATFTPQLTPDTPPPSDLAPFTYPLALQGPHQRINSALAIATLDLLRAQGWTLPVEVIRAGMAQARWPGRLEWVRWQEKSLLIDGAHNPAAAVALRSYVDTLADQTDSAASQPTPTGTTTWIMGMLSTKDHGDVFRSLLRPGDQLHLVPVPGHATADPQELSAIANTLCPDLATNQVHPDLLSALQAATGQRIVLCGSLYLVGHFLATASIERLTRPNPLGPPSPPLS